MGSTLGPHAVVRLLLWLYEETFDIDVLRAERPNDNKVVEHQIIIVPEAPPNIYPQRPTFDPSITSPRVSTLSARRIESFVRGFVGSRMSGPMWLDGKYDTPSDAERVAPRYEETPEPRPRVLGWCGGLLRRGSGDVNGTPGGHVKGGWGE